MDWGPVNRDVTQALAEVGFSVTLEAPPVEGGPDYDPRIGYAAIYPVTVLDRGIRRYRAADSGEELVARTLLMAAGAVTPDKGWYVKIGVDRFRIAEVQTVAPGGVAVMHAMMLEA